MIVKNILELISEFLFIFLFINSNTYYKLISIDWLGDDEM